MDSHAPFILWPWVPIPSTPSILKIFIRYLCLQWIMNKKQNIEKYLTYRQQVLGQHLILSILPNLGYEDPPRRRHFSRNLMGKTDIKTAGPPTVQQ